MGPFFPLQKNFDTMKVIQGQKTVKIPAGVTANVDRRVVTVTGPRGTLSKSFTHIACEIMKVNDDEILIQLWFTKGKEGAALRTIASHILNLIKGVTLGFKYKVRCVYAHFPIQLTVDGNQIFIRNFLGEKITRKVPVIKGVEVVPGKLKDEFVFSGNNIEDVSRNCALVHQSCLVKNKDIRKFLDGIYVSEK